MPSAYLRRLLAHPLTASLDLDSPEVTRRRKQIIASKPFLKAIYDEWYRMLARELPSGEGSILELGSGAGYCSKFIPGLVTSELFVCPGIRIVADALRLPFVKNSLRAIVMTDVLHHIPQVRLFFAGASRCLRPGGKILMIEPWVTPWSRFVYARIHHEPFCPGATTWEFNSNGPLSDANTALPWIIFERDRNEFENEFPEFSIETIRPFMPFRYIVSGGVGMRSLMPEFTHSAWALLERALEFDMHRLGMFAFVELRKN
ncbi:MAG TPA: class I SAM-dependent methyltransferase [Candidatus Acidoferrum sp.]|nr:class I SAM-dependent methyltransferase [Candidatus Acidoferrum sp.]